MHKKCLELAIYIKDMLTEPDNSGRPSNVYGGLPILLQQMLLLEIRIRQLDFYYSEKIVCTPLFLVRQLKLHFLFISCHSEKHYLVYLGSILFE